MEDTVRAIFLGTPAFAVPILAAIEAAGHDIALVVTQPDRPAGRGQRLAAPPVAELACRDGLPLWQTAGLRGGDAEARLRQARADVMVLAAFAALVPGNLLQLSPAGILNVHPSLLPRWRGASPIQAALLAGEPQTGVSIIRLVEALDAGPILAQRRTAISSDDDYLSLEERLSALGAALLLDVLADLERGTVAAREQNDAEATSCRKIERDDARIDWARPAEEIWRAVRAYRGWPQAFTGWDGRLLKVLRATPLAAHAGAAPGRVLATSDLQVVTGSGTLRLDSVVLAGGRPQTGAALKRGHPGLVGARLS